MGSVVDVEMPSVAETAARKARRDHSTATVTILHSRKENPSVKAPVGSGFVVKLENGRCKVMTCEHVIHDFIDSAEYDLWVRFFNADEDVLATVLHHDELRDLAVVDAAQLPARPNSVNPTTLRFSKKRKIGLDVVLLGYFNPPAIDALFHKKAAIAKLPNSVPGKILGPLRHRPDIPDMVTFPHSCYGIDESSGSPIVSHDSGMVVGVFDSSISEVHSAIATKTVKAQLGLWLRDDGTTTTNGLIKKL